MKVLAISIVLIAFLAGCSGTPSKEAAIEDRDQKPVETQPLGTDNAQVATTGKPAEAVVTSGSSIQPISTKPVAGKPAETVETKGVATPNTEVKRLAEAKTASDTDNGAAAGKAHEGSALPYSGGMSQADLKDPNSLLSKRRVMFDYDSSAIRDEFRTMLEAHAQYLKSNKAAKVILQGNTDERGSREYNLALGQRRAESVFKALNLLGVPEGQMEAVSLGEEKPIAEGHDETAWAQNRRTEILYQGD